MNRNDLAAEIDDLKAQIAKLNADHDATRRALWLAMKQLAAADPAWRAAAVRALTKDIAEAEALVDDGILDEPDVAAARDLLAQFKTDV